MQTRHVSALGALVLIAGLVSGCASEEGGRPAANLTAGAARETVFEDFIVVGEDPGDGGPRALGAGELDALLAAAVVADEFPSSLTDDDRRAMNDVAGRYFLEQVVDSEVLDVKDVDAIRAHALVGSELLTPELAAELAAAEPRWDDVLFPTNLGAVGMTADPGRDTVAGTRYASVDLVLSRFAVAEDQVRPVLVYQADTVRPVLGAAGEPVDEHRTIIGTFTMDQVEGQWRISDIATELTTATSAPGKSLG